VQPGDTLTHVGLRYSVSVTDLVSANGLTDPDHIFVGQRLLIPPTEPSESSVSLHVVQNGETLLRIAQRYDVAISDLVAANGLADPDRILAGQQLTIPQPVAVPAEAGLPAPFLGVEVAPSPALQGQTVVIRIRTHGLFPGARVYGRLLGQEFEFATDSPGGGGAWALVGIPALTEPGNYALLLIAEGAQPAARIWLTVLAGDFSTDYIQLSPETSRLLDPALIQEEWARLNRHWSTLHRSRLWHGSFSPPVARGTRVSSSFGTRRSYNGQPARSYHEGIDFATSEGTPVYAPAAGRAVLAEELAVRGMGVLIDHGWGVVSGYFHLSRIEAEAGQQVRPGDLIGRVGSSGLSTGSHLHWEIRVRSVPVDPGQWTQQTIP